MTIKTWSFSRLQDFEACPYRAKLKYIDKVPEPDRPLPPGKTEHANDRGTRIHDAAERYVIGGIELIPELKLFEPEFKKLRSLYKQGRVSLEGEWAVDRNWIPTAYYSEDTWARIKLDALVHIDKECALVIDYKTGRRNGNEIKHGEQMQLYQLATLMRYVPLQRVRVELWYLDLDEIYGLDFRREQGLRFFKNFNDRGTKMTTATEFEPRPNIYSCRWCPYKDEVCPHSIKK